MIILILNMNSFLAELMRRIKLILDWFSSWEITTVFKEEKKWRWGKLAPRWWWWCWCYLWQQYIWIWVILALTFFPLATCLRVSKHSTAVSLPNQPYIFRKELQESTNSSEQSRSNAFELNVRSEQTMQFCFHQLRHKHWSCHTMKWRWWFKQNKSALFSTFTSSF